MSLFPVKDDKHITINPNFIKSPVAMNQNNYNNGNLNISSIVDEQKLLLFIEFKNEYDLNGITLYSYLSQTDFNKSPPKQVTIYKTNKINVNKQEISSMPNDLSIQCSAEKLNNGQKINLKNKSKKFENTKYLIIYIQSNQNNTNQTYLNGIKFDGCYSKSPTKSNQINEKVKETLKSNTESILEPSTDLEFSEMIKHVSSQTLLVIEFYAKWCPHSQRIMSQYKRIAQKFKNKDVIFMRVDMDDLDAIASEYNICSTPTFRFIRNDKCLRSIEGADIKNVMQTVQQYT